MATLLMQWNANGLACRTSEFKQHVANNAYDVICLLEPDKRFSVPGYDVIRSDRDSARGGLAILLRHDVKYMYISLPSPQSIESHYPQRPVN